MKCQISRKICWRQGRVGRWFQDFWAANRIPF
jgi:hypothetical protein